MNRREFIRSATITTSALIAGGIGFYSNQRRVIILSLVGGNDGLNTVVPYKEDLYFKSRPTIALHPNELIHISDTLGFHPSLEHLRGVWDQGFMTVINNVGFQVPEATHQQAILNWQNETLLAKEGVEQNKRETAMGNMLTLPGGPKDTETRTSSSYPAHAFAQQLQKIARSIQSGSSTILYQASLSGFDTPVDQLSQHAALLDTFARSVKALIADLRSSGHFQDTAILSYSEFGRTLQENKSGGTHHGAGNCLFLFGERLQTPGVFNESRLSAAEHGGMPVTIDYRCVYASLRNQWLGGSSSATFEPLALF